MTFHFQILIDNLFLALNTTDGLAPIENKHVLSLATGFEDGKWKFSDFQSFIWDNIAETALSQRERESLVNRSHSQLTAAAKNLRLTDKSDDVSKGSELAEIVLYGVMKNHYKALPVVPKIFYKQNPQDNAKGADSVHIVLEGDDEFSLWFGEAKFYNSIADARLGSIVESVGNSLDTQRLKKENAIIANLQDIDALVPDESLRKKIKSAIDNRNSIDNITGKIHIPILLIHECGITGSTAKFDDSYKSAIVEFHRDRANAYFKNQITKLNGIHKYPEITFHLILLPVPNKKAIVDKFISNVEHYKEQ